MHRQQVEKKTGKKLDSKSERREFISLLGVSYLSVMITQVMGCSAKRPVLQGGGNAARPSNPAAQPPGGNAPPQAPNQPASPSQNNPMPTGQTAPPQATVSGATVPMQDIKIVSLFRETGVLTTAMMMAGKEVSFEHWDGDGHQIIVTPDHMAALKRGEVVKFKTTTANYHDHGVTIDPKNTVPGSSAANIPV